MRSEDGMFDNEYTGLLYLLGHEGVLGRAESHVINIHEDPEMRPPFASGKPHAMGEGDDLRDCWILADKPNVMI